MVCWFVGFSMDNEVWHHSTFTKSQDRLLEGEVAQILEQARSADLLSREHFSVDGTLIEALASLNFYRPKDEEEPPPQGGGRNPTVDFRSEIRCLEPHESRTDPDALLFRRSKGSTAKFNYMGHLLTENHHGLVVDTKVTQATEASAAGFATFN